MIIVYVLKHFTILIKKNVVNHSSMLYDNGEHRPAHDVFMPTIFVLSFQAMSAYMGFLLVTIPVWLSDLL